MPRSFVTSMQAAEYELEPSERAARRLQRMLIARAQEMKPALNPEIEAARDFSDERIVAKHQLAEAEVTAARFRSREFASLRHLMKFQFKGEQQRWSLNDIERELFRKQKDRADMVNLLLPGKGKEIDAQVNRLAAMKKAIQEELNRRATELTFKTEIAEQSAKIMRAALEDIRSERAAVGRAMPGPNYTPEEQIRLSEIASRHRDAALLEHLREVARVSEKTHRHVSG